MPLMMLPEHSTVLVLLFAKGIFQKVIIAYSESWEPSTVIIEASESTTTQGEPWWKEMLEGLQASSS